MSVRRSLEVGLNRLRSYGRLLKDSVELNSLKVLSQMVFGNPFTD